MNKKEIEKKLVCDICYWVKDTMSHLSEKEKKQAIKTITERLKGLYTFQVNNTYISIIEGLYAQVKKLNSQQLIQQRKQDNFNLYYLEENEEESYLVIEFKVSLKLDTIVADDLCLTLRKNKSSQVEMYNATIGYCVDLGGKFRKLIEVEKEDGTIEHPHLPEGDAFCIGHNVFKDLVFPLERNDKQLIKIRQKIENVLLAINPLSIANNSDRIIDYISNPDLWEKQDTSIKFMRKGNRDG